MNNQNLISALLGGSIVALTWAASAAMTVQGLLVGLSVYAMAAALIVVVQDYNSVSKSRL